MTHEQIAAAHGVSTKAIQRALSVCGIDYGADKPSGKPSRVRRELGDEGYAFLLDNKDMRPRRKLYELLVEKYRITFLYGTFERFMTRLLARLLD